MNDLLQFSVYEGGRRLASRELQAPVELGRVDRDDAEVFDARDLEDRRRLPIASRQEVTIGRRQLLVEAMDADRVRLTNLSDKVDLRILNDQSMLATEASRVVELPAHVMIGSRRLSIDPVRLASLSSPPPKPSPDDPPQSILHTILATGRGADRAAPTPDILPWVEAAMQIQSGGSEQAVLERAVRHLQRLLSLDVTAVAVPTGGQWAVRCRHISETTAAEASTPGDEASWAPSRRVLAMVAAERKTFWQLPEVCTGSIAGFAAVIASPILDHAGSVAAVLYGQRIEGSAGSVAVTETHAMLAELLAGSVAAALAQKRLLEQSRDLEIGRSIQQSFLPSEVPQPPGWQVAVAFQPARDVSGDFYDIFRLSPRHLLIAVADVCDKGVGSALYMTLFRSLLRAYAQEAAETERLDETASAGDSALNDRWAAAVLKHAVAKTNRYVVQTHGWQCMFCTLIAVVIDQDNGELTYINAGHDEPIIRRCDGTMKMLPTTGPVVGIEENAAFGVARERLEAGDCFFGYSDGVPDARNKDGEYFTRGRLLDCVSRGPTSAVELTDELMRRLQRFIGLADPHDDITVAVVVRENR